MVAISADSAADSKRLRERLGLNFPLLTDEGVAVASAYGVAMKGEDIAVPATFVIMPNREVFWHYVGETPADRPGKLAVIEQLEAALAELAGS
ncbi:AhpC/TSA family protein [Enhygromyxa salina]|uniref:AhpC/TSA family protein n=1 Tax=Enhygromyxa salina TaxID=215803 RepID=A0A2S9YRB0_9BACT|nr:AhpC/TSA family protein [Enhygromyxa salina]